VLPIAKDFQRVVFLQKLNSTRTTSAAKINKLEKLLPSNPLPTPEILAEDLH